MINPSIEELFGQESPYYDDEYMRETFKDLPHFFGPFSAPPDPPTFDITTPSPPDPSSTISLASADAGPPAVEDLSSGESSPDQATDIPKSPQVSPEVNPALIPVSPQSSTIPATPSLSPLASSAFFSPTNTYAAASVSPPASKRRYSLVDEPDPSQGSIPGPSAPRRTKGPRPSYAGESSFQLGIVPPLEPSVPAKKPTRKSRDEKPYSACQCPGGPSQKPPRHWETSCPFNPNAGQKRVSCEYCDKTFSTKYNKNRHVKEQH